MLHYLKIAKQKKIIPNFWLTEEYLGNIKGLKEYQRNGWIWLQDRDWCLFPPLLLNWNMVCGFYPKVNIWSDFINYKSTLHSSISSEFLDYEYWYTSTFIHNLEGPKRASFRKNIRKWPKNNTGVQYTLKKPNQIQIENLLTEWVSSRKLIHDPDIMVNFVLFGKNRAFLMRKNELVGMNVWDSNGPIYMYRFCLNIDEPFLNEFLRYLFYKNIYGYVIDGGCLGLLGLENFKDRLQPLIKRKVYSNMMKENYENK